MSKEQVQCPRCNHKFNVGVSLLNYSLLAKQLKQAEIKTRKEAMKQKKKHPVSIVEKKEDSNVKKPSVM